MPLVLIPVLIAVILAFGLTKGGDIIGTAGIIWLIIVYGGSFLILATIFYIIVTYWWVILIVIGACIGIYFWANQPEKEDSMPTQILVLRDEPKPKNEFADDEFEFDMDMADEDDFDLGI